METLHICIRKQIVIGNFNVDWSEGGGLFAPAGGTYPSLPMVSIFLASVKDGFLLAHFGHQVGLTTCGTSIDVTLRRKVLCMWEVCFICDVDFKIRPRWLRLTPVTTKGVSRLRGGWNLWPLSRSGF